MFLSLDIFLEYCFGYITMKPLMSNMYSQLRYYAGKFQANKIFCLCQAICHLCLQNLQKWIIHRTHVLRIVPLIQLLSALSCDPGSLVVHDGKTRPNPQQCCRTMSWYDFNEMLIMVSKHVFTIHYHRVRKPIYYLWF